MYVFDDEDPQARDGQFRYKIENKGPNSKQNYVDFDYDIRCSAIACENGLVMVQNQQTQKVEGTLNPNITGRLPEVKICRFLRGQNMIVSADMDGYVNFYATTPSVYRNQFLMRKNFIIDQEQLRAANRETLRPS